MISSAFSQWCFGMARAALKAASIMLVCLFCTAVCFLCVLTLGWGAMLVRDDYESRRVKFHNSQCLVLACMINTI
jgi:hypothetical protein